MNLFEKCAGSLLGKELTWINEPGEWGFHSNQSLAISAPASADFFRDPSGEIVVASAPFLFTKIKGDFILTTKVSVEMKAQYDSGCLMVMADDLNWAKLCFEFFENKPSILSIVTKDTSDDCISGQVETTQPYLRMAKSGSSFAFHYSLDGENWRLVRYFSMKCPSDVKVGLVVQSPLGKGCTATFDFLELSANTNHDVRVVS